MDVLLDTNVIMDFIGNREPFFEDANALITMCTKKVLHGFIAVHSASTVYYLMRRFVPDGHTRRRMLKGLFRTVDIGAADREAVLSALDHEEFSDFEDALQYECAQRFGASYIITRDIKDFVASDIPVCTPKEFLAKFAS